MDFVENLNLIIERSGIFSLKQIAGKVGIDRSTLSRLRSGQRSPTARHLTLIAQFAGLANPSDLLLSHSQFKAALNALAPTDSALHSLRLLARSIPNCRSLAHVYVGQYILYAPSSRPSTVIGSLLEIGEITPHGYQVSIVNPYNGHDGEYLAFMYTGFAVPVSEYVYVIAEQIDASYEITSLIFHAAPIAPAQVLEGIWSGIGVRRNRRFVSASPCVAMRTRKTISDWRTALGSALGYLPLGSMPTIVQMKLGEKGITVVS